MFAVGHLALGYFFGKGASKVLNENINLPMLFLASVLPDFDLLIPGLEHRGPTHSLILACLIFLPALLLYKKRSIPYFMALTQHSILGDFLTGGTQLFWPLTTKWYGLGITIMGPINILQEWVLFITSFTLMLKIGDARALLQPHPSNLLLFIPILTVFLPPFFSFPLRVPLELVVPHLTYLTFFILSILKDLTSGIKITEAQ